MGIDFKTKKDNCPLASFYRVEVRDEIDSTNTAVFDAGNKGEAEGFCMIAKRQTAGRGRRGRNFFSPENTGLYLSVLLRPSLDAEKALLITTAAAVAGAKACERICGKNVEIKWVNDLFLDGRKIAGILTEGSIKPGTSKLEFAVMGIGINVIPPKGGWPEEISSVAGALCDSEESYKDVLDRLSTEFLNEFYDLYSKLPNTDYIEEYRKRQLATGKRINVLSGDGSFRKAEALGVDDCFRLRVKFDGEEKESAIDTGEISIRIED